MEIIAQSKDGVIITATNEEVKGILAAVNGKKPSNITIGQKIPAIDYATTIMDIKDLAENYRFTNLIDNADRFVAQVEELKAAVLNASDIK